VEEYLGRLQVIVTKVRPAEEDEYELEDFMPHTERDIEEMLTMVRETIASVENPHLRTLLDKFFADEEFVAAFSRAPAARRIHHAYLGGLLEHTLSVVETAIAITHAPGLAPFLATYGIGYAYTAGLGLWQSAGKALPSTHRHPIAVPEHGANRGYS